MAEGANPIMVLENGPKVSSREVLLALNKGGLEKELNSASSCEESQDIVARVVKAIVAIIRSNEASAKDLAAACDTTKILLKNLNDISTPNVWMQIFDASSVLFERNKGKAGRKMLKQLLSVLPAGPVGLSIQNTVVSVALDVFLTNNPPHSLVFNAFVLDLFLNQCMSFEQLVGNAWNSLFRVGREWELYLDQFGLGKLARRCLDSLSYSSKHPDPERAQCRNSVLALTSTFFVSAIHIDSPAAVAHFLQTFLTTIHAKITLESILDQYHCFHLLQEILVSYPDSVDTFTVHIFPVLHRAFDDGFHDLLQDAPNLQQLQDHSDRIIGFRLAVIGFLKKIGHIELQSHLDQTIEMAFGRKTYLGSDADRIIYSISQHPNATLRIHIMALLFASEKSKQGISHHVLRQAKELLPYIHGLHDPRLRIDTFPLVKQMIIRIFAGCERDELNYIHINTKAAQTERIYTDFLHWYLSFLNSDLYPTASYPRHVFALKVLLYILEVICSGLGHRDSFQTDRKHIPLLGEEIFQIPFQWPLFNLILDPYEDIRHLASLILRYYLNYFVRAQKGSLSPTLPFQMWTHKPSEGNLSNGLGAAHISIENGRIKNEVKLSRSVEQILEPTFWKDAISSIGCLASQTNRADHADGFGRLLELYFLLTSDKLDTPRPKADMVDHIHASENLGSNVIGAIIESFDCALLNSPDPLTTPLEDFPLHGCLQGLRYCLTHMNAQQCLCTYRGTTESLAGKIVAICEKIWDAVSDRLCIDAPERETDELEVVDTSAGPKDMLSYCWRALHDASLVLHALLSTKIFLSDAQDPHSSIEILERIGKLCMDQMTRLRHRGAFTAVSRAFELFCQRCTASRREDCGHLLIQLFDVSIDTSCRFISDQKQTGKVRMVRMDDTVTRRSAGFPAFMSAILMAKDAQFFKHFMTDFSHRALQLDAAISPGKTVSLPQVHYLNCLREVYLTGQLRDWSASWLEAGIAISSECIVSETWAIRNCGLMLLRAITNRLSRSKRLHYARDALLFEEESRIPLRRSPMVGILALRLLYPEIQNRLGDVPEILPKSEILTRFLASSSTVLSSPMSVNPDPETLCMAMNIIGRINFGSEDAVVVQSLMSRLLAHKDWLVRDLAARTLSKVTDIAAEALASVQIMLASKDSADQNDLHGRLLAARYIFRKCCLRYSQSQIVSLTRAMGDALRETAPRIVGRETHPAIKASFLDILNDYSKVVLFKYESQAPDNGFDVENIVEIASLSNLQAAQRDGFSLLLRATILTQWLLYLIKSTHAKLHPERLEAFRDLSPDTLTSVRPDALRYTILELSEDHILDAERALAMAKLYLATLRNTRSEDITALAARRLAALLGSLKESDRVVWEQFGLSEAHNWVKTNNLANNHSRETWTASICLRAALIKHDHAAMDLLECPLVNCSFCHFSKQLREAVNDEIDLPTRQAGLESLSYLESVLAGNVSIMPDNHRTSIIVALYDLLNDDDDDIREGAASIASTIYSKAKDPSAMKQPLTSAAVGPKLLLFLALQYKDEELRKTALQRLFVPQFADAVQAVQTKNKNVLFEEEKQNLYRDDVREAKTWASVLGAMSPPRSLSEYANAATEGLRYMLEHRALVVGSLKIDTEILVLCVRVVLMAEVLLRWQHEDELKQLVRDARELLSIRYVLPDLSDPGGMA